MNDGRDRDDTNNGEQGLNDMLHVVWTRTHGKIYIYIYILLLSILLGYNIIMAFCILDLLESKALILIFAYWTFKLLRLVLKLVGD